MHLIRITGSFKSIYHSQGYEVGAGDGAAGADTFWSKPELEPSKRSRSRQKRGGSGSEKGYNCGKKRRYINSELLIQSHMRTSASESEPEPPKPVHFARSRNRRRKVLLGAGAGARILPRSRSRSRPKMSRLRIPHHST